MADQPNGEDNSSKGDTLKPLKSQPMKRLRWATTRVNAAQGKAKRRSILDRIHKRSPSTKTSSSGGSDEDSNEVSDEFEGDPRTVYFNQSLPRTALDEDGHSIYNYPRNKIRTSKYTPLSFIPKNLWLQFHNVANVYFLFIVILSIFAIFGASNPGLNAVPLIVIVTVTAIKDGVEDFRRTVLDNELNNSPVHRLVEWNNVNVADERVGLWRKFKKANTRAIVNLWRKMNSRKKGEKGYTDRALDIGANGDANRPTIEVPRDDVELTPVASPRHSGDMANMSRSYSDMPADKEAFLKVPGAPTTIPKRDFGNIIDPAITTPEKARFTRDYWKNVKVGDFVRLYNEEPVPADIVVLSTSDPDGACYVETKNLDGETNLKVRQALRCSRKVRRARDCEKTVFRIESEPPHANLYSYSGVARWQQKDYSNPEAEPEAKSESITINNLLLRGCNIRNTEWVLGVVVFTGQETKIMLNAGVTPTKRARITRELNWNVIYNFIVLFFMCLIAAIVEGTSFGKSDTSITYFEFGSYGGSGGLNGFITFWAAIILFQNLVPISLYITLEIIRTAQAYFIYSDTWMYYEKIDYPCTPKSWNICDDVGQIEYIFSDKTGTLTQNVMEFKKCTINGSPYGEAYTEALAGLQKRQGINTEKEGARAREQIARDRTRMLFDLRKLHDNPYLYDDELTFVAPDFVQDLQGVSGEAQKQANAHFMLALALCHTVITERTPGDPPRIEFKAQSPDEAALVATARDVGYTVVGRTTDGIIINAQGVEQEYTVLNTLEFNSSRKRMSAIIRMPDGKIILFCKGADSIIYERLEGGKQSELRRQTSEHLEMFAREGLRTLCIAQRELDEDYYQEWNKRHDEAAAAVVGRDDKLELVSDEIERELILLGGTAIEDRLQDGVPNTISLLANAGIKLWVLTGDKVETAINIGFSCNLLSNEMELITFRYEEPSLDKADEELTAHLRTFGLTGSDEELVAARKNHEAPASTHAVIIDGDALKLVLDPSLKQKFLLLCKQCKAVLCCRVSPAQKAAVVQLVKDGLDVITLSVGDGANDVAMIQEADVGVGIAGEEGRQAVMSSDFALGQFRFLARLILVHGRWNYRRMGETIANFFYKNIVWTFGLFWYQIYANFDCAYIFDYTYILLYNLAFTSLSIIFMGILDQDVSDLVSLAVPQLYRRGIERKEWTQPKFWLYMLDGLYQSLMVYYMVYCLFLPANFVSENGLNLNDTKRMGVYIACAAVVVVNIYILLNTYRWDWLMLLIIAISILLVWFWTGVYTQFTSSFQFYNAAQQVYGQLSFWTTSLLTIIICLAPRFVVKSFQKIYMPYDVDIIREQVRQGKFEYLNHVDLNDPNFTGIESDTSNENSSNSAQMSHKQNGNPFMGEEDERPMYPPSTAHTATTRNPHSQQNSDDSQIFRPPRISIDRPRPSYERARASMDRVRASFEAHRDFTSAARLQRVESSYSQSSANTPASPAARSRSNLHDQLQQ